MSAVLWAKKIVESLPEPVARAFSYVPFSVRLGRAYSSTVRSIRSFDVLDEGCQRDWLFQRLRYILEWAYDRSPFYRELYSGMGFRPEHFRSLDDWSRVPVVSKEQLREFPVETRCIGQRGALRLNTGGTSGSPLAFCVDRNAFAREWAHMHHIWKARGYRPRDLKLTLRGKQLHGDVLRYNAVHNEYVVDATAPLERVVLQVSDLLRKKEIHWLHGYPSLVSEFCLALERHAGDRGERLRGGLKGVLLGSEYPAPVYRDAIARIASQNIVCWYGHSEMGILAYEDSAGIYHSLPTYGFAELLSEDGDGQTGRLLATSLHNTAHPFIRYDTADRVRAQSAERGRLSFSVVEGRVGDFIIDRKGQRIALTAVIFGRHHRAFEVLAHVQVSQSEPGKATLLVVPRDADLGDEQLKSGFDLDGLDIEWDLRRIASPIRSSAGKLSLKVIEQQ